LHRDALHCVFAFAEWRDLLQCARSCRDWLAAAVSSRPLRARSLVDIYAATLRGGLLRSPLAVHLATVAEADEHEYDDGDREKRLWPLLPALASALPQLTELVVTVPFGGLSDLSFRLPAQLKALELRVKLPALTNEAAAPPLPELSAAEHALLLPFLEHLAAVSPAGLSRVTLKLERNKGKLRFPAAALAALSRIASLTDLRVDAQWDDAAVRRVVRSMLQLRAWRRGWLRQDRDSLIPIFRRGAQRRWRS